MDPFRGIVDRHLQVLVELLGEVCVAQAAPVMAGLGDDAVVGVINATTDAIRELEGLRVVATGIAAQRSGRDAGHGGLAQRLGHRNAVSLVQDLTGVSKAQAGKVTRLGQALLEAAAGDSQRPEPVEGHDPDEDSRPEPVEGHHPDEDSRPEPVEGHHPAPARPWHACLSDAFTAGRISVDQQSAIRRGLGEPPARTGALGPADVGPAGAPDPATVAAWAAAAAQLIEEASRRTVEDLAAAARVIRDRLDPEGAGRRYDEQVEARSFRMWTDNDGVPCARIQFEPGGGAWAAAILDAALRPRRGGPRFVDPAEKASADLLAADPRTNEQLAYDLLIDVLHAGALADAARVFGTRQAGIRVVITRAARDTAATGEAGIAVIEETRAAVPATFAAQHACDTGHVACVLDAQGNPLDLGRETRLFTARQRVALGIRDGGCGWHGCDRPASYCEAHHIDPYADGGKTDVDRGILLCRFHHMTLHNNDWRITRDRTGPFTLHSPDPDTPPVELQPRLERRYLWGDLQPPPTRFRPAA